MNILSLFDGISCARVACDRAGIKVKHYFASEVDKYAIQVSDKNYPDIHRLGDVRNVSSNYIKGFHLVIGGSPCQDLSIAKKERKGLQGERSSLFYEFVRVVKEQLPKYFILENVNSMSKEAKEIISHELFDIEPVMINASLVSAQNRKRLFWVGVRDTSLLSGVTYRRVEISQPEDRGILLRDILESGEVDRVKSYAIDANYHKGANWEQYQTKKRRQLVRIGYLNSGAQGDRIYSPDGKSVSLSANGGGRGAKTGLYAVPVALRNRGEGKRPEYNNTEKANALTTVQTDSMVQEDIVIRKLTPIECERLQGLPDNYTEGISNTQRYKCLGNAFNVDVVAHILKHLEV